MKYNNIGVITQFLNKEVIRKNYLEVRYTVNH